MPRNRDGDIASHNQSIKRNPSLRHPWAKDPEKSGFVWVHINARKILDQYSKGVGTIRIKEGAPEVQYAFLAPLTLTEQAVHNWTEYDSIASRLAQKVRSAAKIGAEFQGLVNTFGDNANIEDQARGILGNKSIDSGSLATNWIKSVYNKVAPHSIPKIKVDTPLYYESSNRRSLSFEVILIAENNPRYDVVEPVHDLMKYSSPALRGAGGIDIEFPYMFEVYTRPKEWIKYSTLALEAVQPTWNQPYIGGYPSNCILQLTFKDMSPLYRSAIESGSVINVISGTRSQENEQIGPPTTVLKWNRPPEKTSGKGSTSGSQGNTGSGDPSGKSDKPIREGTFTDDPSLSN